MPRLPIRLVLHLMKYILSPTPPTAAAFLRAPSGGFLCAPGLLCLNRSFQPLVPLIHSLAGPGGDHENLCFRVDAPDISEALVHLEVEHFAEISFVQQYQLRGHEHVWILDGLASPSVTLRVSTRQSSPRSNAAGHAGCRRLLDEQHPGCRYPSAPAPSSSPHRDGSRNH